MQITGAQSCLNHVAIELHVLQSLSGAEAAPPHRRVLGQLGLLPHPTLPGTALQGSISESGTARDCRHLPELYEQHKVGKPSQLLRASPVAAVVAEQEAANALFLRLQITAAKRDRHGGDSCCICARRYSKAGQAAAGIQDPPGFAHT